MAAIDDLNTAVSALNTSLSNVLAEIKRLDDKITAHTATDQAIATVTGALTQAASQANDAVTASQTAVP